MPEKEKKEKTQVTGSQKTMAKQLWRISRKMNEEKPERITPKNVCYWYEREGLLVGTQKSKARKFLELGCVLETEEPELFIIKHIEGYNVTNHRVNNKENTCSCQFYQKVGKECSHMIAVKLYLFMKKWNETKREENKRI